MLMMLRTEFVPLEWFVYGPLFTIVYGPLSTIVYYGPFLLTIATYTATVLRGSVPHQQLRPVQHRHLHKSTT
jgi:hypothetical protein